MVLVTLSLGSNIDAAANIRKAVGALQDRYDEVRLSPVYESEAVGFAGDNFLNLVVSLRTDSSLATLSAELKQLELKQGRVRSGGGLAARTIDIDILTFDNLQGSHADMELPRAEIIRHAFVLQPLADLLPEAEHPALGKSYALLWEQFKSENGASQRLWQVPFDWHYGN